MRHSFLTIYELHIHELIEFVLKSINGLHQQYFCNILFNFNRTTGKLIRILINRILNLLKTLFCKKKLERSSIRFRGPKLYNKLKIMQIIPNKLEKGSQAGVTSFCHKLKNSYLVSNYELIRFVFN